MSEELKPIPDALKNDAPYLLLPEVLLARRGMASIRLEVSESVAGHFNALIFAAFRAIAAWNRRPSPPVVDGELWQPIETAPRDIAVVMPMGTVTLRHSYPIWVRTDRGEAREASWCQRREDGDVGYWWDWDAEDVIDPDEWFPHPLYESPRSDK